MVFWRLVCQHLCLSNHRRRHPATSRSGHMQVLRKPSWRTRSAHRATSRACSSLPRDAKAAKSAMVHTLQPLADDLESDGSQLHAEVVFTTPASSRDTCASVKPHTLLMCSFCMESSMQLCVCVCLLACWSQREALRIQERSTATVPSARLALDISRARGHTRSRAREVLSTHAHPPLQLALSA